MQEDAVMLEETVVIGYGTQKKVNVTGAVASISGKELGKPCVTFAYQHAPGLCGRSQRHHLIIRAWRVG